MHQSVMTKIKVFATEDLIFKIIREHVIKIFEC